MGLIHQPLWQRQAAIEAEAQILVGNIVAQVIGSLFFFLRAYSRLVVTKTWRTEDYILLAAWLCTTGWTCCQYGQIRHGAGRYFAALEPNDPVMSQKYAYAAQILLFPALALPKLSICCTYLPLMVLLVLLIIPMDIEVILQCRPIHVYWSEGRPPSKCLDDIAGFFVSGTLNIVVDAALMAIVLPRVMGLKLHRRQRYALMGVVLLGTLAIVAGIIRMVRTNTEIWVAMICAAAPGIKPVLVKILPKLLGTTLRSRTRTKPSGGATGPSIEMGSKWKRNTRASSHVHAQTSETALASVQGLYTECGRGVDDDSISEDRSERFG
ncbi:hypothetical protein HBI30_230740 [Parastagonospora nodorum]|nr:hypothetical protein HBI30_230740 [Parastagonospora nodorum]